MYLGFQVEQDSSVNDASPHIANIGRMVEVRTVRLTTSVFVFLQLTFLSGCYLHTLFFGVCLF